MTVTEFRSSPERVTAMKELLSNNPIFAEAVVCFKDNRPPTNVPNGSDALEHVRALARVQQHEEDVNLLLSLTEPLSSEPVERPPNWEVDLTKFPNLNQTFS